MGNMNTFLTEDDYRQIHDETGCKSIHMSISLPVWGSGMYM